MGSTAVGLGGSNWKDKVLCECERGLSTGNCRDMGLFIFLH